MRSRLTLASALAALLLPLTALAQEEEPDPGVFGMYFHCNQSKEARADTIIAEQFGPILDRHVAEGNINSWGWYAHHTGGHWRRLLYMVGADVPSVMMAREALESDLEAEAADALPRLMEVCPSHDDQVWEVTAASDPLMSQGRPSVAMSTYMVCDFVEEGRTDDMVEESLAEIYNRHVAEGTITGWSWLTHNIGGEYRRVSVIDATDLASLLAARGQIIEDLWEEEPLTMNAFSEICGSHTDYIWEMRITKP
ncbi:MAG: hypothetical protein JSV95_13335 [Gemmatimonadota bacterium]|jgi:hypothetical protein|nr:MAG: hypothetical protein JSV95_13335 [Gemmatimonadota bacterium]